MDYINIGTRRELFWDDYIVDTSLTTAKQRIHNPIRRDMVFLFDAPWEGGNTSRLNVRRVGSVWRMYYAGQNIYNEDGSRSYERRHSCYIESKDGIHWERPNLGQIEFNGSKDNNIIDVPTYLENTRPNSPEEGKFVFLYESDGHEEKYGDEYHELLCLGLSSDGIHAETKYVIDHVPPRAYDSNNIVLWNEAVGKYQAFFRGFHGFKDNKSWWDTHKLGIRDIRYMQSEDLVHWTPPVQIIFDDGAPDYPLYENEVVSYYRAPHVLMGLPVRYTERDVWTKNYDALPDAVSRRERYKEHPRYGLALTDTLFMCSRDGLNWTRQDEAFLRPGPEAKKNWIYGDGYMSRGIVETASQYEGEENEMSIYQTLGDWYNAPGELWRYTLRLDGFVSRHAGYSEETLVTKPFRFVGNELEINFETSAAGYVIISVCDINGRPLDGYTTCQLFGDSSARRVSFDAPLNFFVKYNIPVRLSFKMSDADIYSFRFTD